MPLYPAPARTPRPAAIVVCLGIVAVVIGMACTATMAGPPVCSAASSCAKGFGCVLGRCRQDKTIPVATLAPRISFAPVDLLAIGPEGKRTQTELDATIVLGHSGSGHTTLLLRFDVDLRAGGEPRDNPPPPVVQRALLVFEPTPLCDNNSGQLSIEVALLSQPWSEASVVSRMLPRMSLPAYAGSYPMAPPQPLRIDVTEIVRDWVSKRATMFGLAVLAAAAEGDSGGGCYASGNGIARGPRLEVFLQPPEQKKKATKGAGGAGGGGAAARRARGFEEEDDDEVPPPSQPSPPPRGEGGEPAQPAGAQR